MKDMLIKSYLAAAAIGAYLITAWGDEDGIAKKAVDGSAPLMGTTGIVGADAAGDIVDVTRIGMPEVCLGGVVARGARVTADADGKAVAAGVGDYYLGYAETSGVADDIVQITIAPGQMPAA